MTQVVNLRLARKRAERLAREAEAQANRAAHSIPARLRKAEQAKNALSERRFEGLRRPSTEKPGE